MVYQKHRFEHDTNLLSNLNAGNVDAFRKIYDLYYFPVRYFAERILKDREHAEDVVAEGFVVLWDRRGDFESLEKLGGFLYTVVRNRCYDQLAKRKKNRMADRKLGYFLGEGTEDSFLTEQVTAELLRHAFMEAEQLPVEMKKVFDLIYVEGLNGRAAAERLGISIHTVKAQRASAIKRLRAVLGRKGLLGILLLIYSIRVIFC